MRKCILVGNLKNMNDYIGDERKREQNLLIVEGNHEKNRLFWLISKCFPKINIDIDNVWIYGTNIYILYEDIVKEYGSEWENENDDIDLPFVISKKQNLNVLRYKRDFINIIIIFDYERHDVNFSEEKILQMQNFFIDAADMGKLYINYPMLESYQHLRSLPDNDYAERKVPVSLQPGGKYKAAVKDETVIAKSVEFPHRINDLLHEHFGIVNEYVRDRCCNAILDISDDNNIVDMIQGILQGVIEDSELQTAVYHLNDWVMRCGYAQNGNTYWKYMRDIFRQIIYHNICKANKIQNGQYYVENDKLKTCFEQLDLTEILKIQNTFSQDVNTGVIWVLNTCVFFVAEYNFTLAMQER